MILFIVLYCVERNNCNLDIVKKSFREDTYASPYMKKISGKIKKKVAYLRDHRFLHVCSAFH